MRKAVVLLAMMTLGVVACGKGGPKSPQAYCKDFKPVNEKVNADLEKVFGPSSAADLKVAINDMVAQAQKALDANPPKSIRPDIVTAHDTFTSARDELAKVDYDSSKLQGPPRAFQDPKFQSVGDHLDAYGAKYCGIKPSNENQGPPPGPAPQAPAPDVVAIENFQFSANTVAPGTKLTVKNSDQAPHSVTADDKSFDSGIIGGGQSGTITAPTKPGTYAFHCTVHPEMHGVLTIT